MKTKDVEVIYILMFIMKKEENFIQLLDLFMKVLTVKYQMINKSIILIIIKLIIV